MNRMKTKRISSWIVIFFMTLLVVAILAAGCTEEGNGTQTARVEVRLTDDPADYEEVIVDILDVQVKSSSDDSDEGWVSLDVNEGKYDLLKLTNGLDTLLGTAELPAGRVSQVRLVLGEENTVRADGTDYDLNTPSAQQSGLKVMVNTDLEAGKIYTILLDFDAARSVVQAGNGKFNLKPVIRAIAEVTGDVNEDTGGIEGMVSPASASPVMFAIKGADSTSTSTNELGMFLFMNLDTGLYRVVVIPDSALFHPLEVDSVHVTANDITDIGTLILEEK